MTGKLAARQLSKKVFADDLKLSNQRKNDFTPPVKGNKKKLQQQRRDDYDDLESCDTNANCAGDLSCRKVASSDGSSVGKKCIRVPLKAKML